MTPLFSFFFVTISLFTICGWCGASAFLYQSSEWILGIKNPSTISIIFHQNAIRGLLISSLWGIISFYPLYHFHTKKVQPLISLVFLPISMIALCSFYLYMWPPKHEMTLFNAVQILLAEGWLPFTISYLIWIFLPLSIWSYQNSQTPHNATSTSTDESLEGTNQ